MPIFYSPSCRGFLDSDLHKTMPEDAIEISAALHRQLLDGQAKGYEITIDSNGKPVAKAPATRPIADRRAAAIAAVKREAGKRIEAVVPLWRQMNDARLIADYDRGDRTLIEKATAAIERGAAIDALRARSDALEAAIAVMPATQLAGFRAGADHHWETSNAD